jgi:hypothetical protein
VLCEPCHSAEHGKTTPRTKRFSVYCAGKIGISDWRHRLFDLSQGEGYESLWASEDGLIQVSYAGPYFAESQHGSAHGQNTHGRFDYEWLQEQDHVYAGDFGDLDLEARMARRFEVHDKCLLWMKNADAHFFYIDGSGAYGTIVELFYSARAFPKTPTEIFFASEQLAEEYWFLIAYMWRNHRSSLSYQDLIDPDVRKAFQKFAERV